MNNESSIKYRLFLEDNNEYKREINTDNVYPKEIGGNGNYIYRAISFFFNNISFFVYWVIHRREVGYTYSPLIQNNISCIIFS